MESINWYGAYTLTIREIQRFCKVYHQTIVSPIISALIFLFVFVLAIGSSRTEIAGIKFINFMGYGLIIMSIVQNAFANSSSSLIMSKILGYITDILTVPLGSVEIIIAITIGSIARGILVGIAVAIALAPLVDYQIYHPFLLIFFIFSSCMFLGLLGILTGMIANSFDQSFAVTNYLVTPLSFLSGTFYSVKSLPLPLQYVNNFNPFFYMIDGFRYCLTDYADSNIKIGIIFLIIINIILFTILAKLINIGWRIKS